MRSNWKIFFLYGVLVGIILFPSCNNGSDRYFDISDHLESFEQEDQKLISQISDLEIGSAGQMTTEKSQSGIYAIRIDSTAPFALNYKLKTVQADERIVYRVSYQGKGQLVIVAQDKDPEYYYRKITSPASPSSEWQDLVLDIIVPPTMSGRDLNLYVWNVDGQGLFVDDVELSYQKELSYPDYPVMETLHIYMDTLSLLALEKKRMEAFERGILVTEDDDYVDGILFYKDTIMPIELRLKGDWLDHLEGRKWSFRVKVKEGFTWNRLKTFSLHTPWARSFLDEWVAHELLRSNDILAPRYGFAPVALNGKSIGVYAWEEHFEKQLVESLNRREGPMLKFDETHFWHIQEIFANGGAYPTLPVLQAAAISPFKEGKTLADTILRQQFLIGRDLMHQYRFRQNPITEIFDTERFGGYLAFVDLTRGFHGMNWHNQRAYFNPVTCKLEPVFFDGYTELGVYDPQRAPISGMPLLDREQPQKFEDLFWIHPFQDVELVKSYYAWLEKITDPVFLTDFFEQNSARISHYLALIQSEFTEYEWTDAFIFQNAQAIRQELSRLKDYLTSLEQRSAVDTTEVRLQTYADSQSGALAPDYVKVFVADSANNQLRLQATNYYPREISIIGSSELSGRQELVWGDALILPPYEGQVTGADVVPLSVPYGTRYLWVLVGEGGDTFPVPISHFNYPGRETPLQEVSRLYQMNLPKGADVQGNEIVFDGTILLEEPVVIPPGYRVIIHPGTAIDIVEQSFFLSNSPVFARGTKDHPIRVGSSDRSAMGFHVLMAQDTSDLKHVFFSHLNTMNYRGWVHTGAVSFYESPVKIQHCVFRDNLCEDALNIVRTDFLVSDSEFNQIFADAFDSDFCSGLVENVIFTAIGNDAIDFSGSQVHIHNCVIHTVADKGVSCGEQSQLTITDTHVTDAYIGYASKDYSRLELEDCSLDQAVYGLVAFQKKPEFGPGVIRAEGFVATQVDTLHLVEIASQVRINSSLIKGQKKQVALRFY